MLENVTIERKGRKGRKVRQDFSAAFAACVPKWRRLVGDALRNDESFVHREKHPADDVSAPDEKMSVHRTADRHNGVTAIELTPHGALN